MPVRRLPTSFTVVRPLSVGGTPKAKGATLTAAAAISGLGRHLNAYVSRGWLAPNQTVYAGTTRRPNPRTTPTVAYSPRELRTMAGLSF